MSLVINKLEERIQAAVKKFWRTRKKKKGGKHDVGERSSVTAGKHLDGFVSLIEKLVVENGLPESSVKIGSKLPTLPGFFRPTKKWDVLIIHKGVLIAAIEFKSQVGPSFGNNFNNRCEEAIGNALDFQTAFREGAFGKSATKPFLGFIMVLEDHSRSREVVRIDSPHFVALPEFQKTSYAERYEILLDKLVKEGLYMATALVLSKKKASGGADVGAMKSFATVFAGHIATAAARTKG